MNYKTNLLLKLMQMHQVEQSLTYRDGRFSINTSGQSFDDPFQDLIDGGFIDKNGILTPKGRNHFELPDVKKMNNSLVQGIATKCLNQLAFLVENKGWILNEKIQEAFANLANAAVPNYKEEREVVNEFITNTDLPELEGLLEVEKEEEFGLQPVEVVKKGKKVKA